jgi:CDP-diacylglycerol--glycerol-3-phosphate 3-phosphatidyltransferase
MSWPHILSFSRVVAGPVVAALILYRPGDAYLVAAVIFGLATLTDLADGKLARYSQRVSPLGIFIDTTSDKVFVSLTLIAMAVAGLTQAWIPLVVVGREFLISGLRSYAASCNRIISAHIWGKGKAALTMVAIFCLLVAADGTSGGVLARLFPSSSWRAALTVSTWLLGLSAVLTVVSGARYVIDAWPLFRPHAVPRETELEPPRLAAGQDR